MENYDTKPTQKKKNSSHAQSTCNEDSMWWVLIASNNPLLKLPFCPLIIVSDDMLLKIYYEKCCNYVVDITFLLFLFFECEF